MSATLNQVIESIKELSPKERALVAHCLISSLDSQQDDAVDDAWIALSEKRLLELKSGMVEADSWEEVKKQIKG